MKKIVALVLSLVLVLSMSSALAYSADAPITINFWHTYGSGANYNAMKAEVDAFNATVGAEKGIVVNETYIGGYPEIMTKVQLSTQTGEQPAVSVIGNTYVTMLMDDDLIVDLMPYVEKTGFDVSNLLDCFMQIPGNTDGTMYSLPYCRSTALLFYNKTMSDAKGLTAPTTIDELVEWGRAMMEIDETGEVTVWGFEFFNDFGNYNASLLWTLQCPMIDENGDSPALFEGGMLKHLTDWKNWVDEKGVCRPFDAANASATAKEMVYQGKLGGFLASCANLATFTKNMEAAGLEPGIAYFPTYDVDHKAIEVGGGQLVMLAPGNDEETLDAAWEFMQFMMTDEQVCNFAMGTGYLPVTKTAGEYQAMQDFWAENPGWYIPYAQLRDYGICQEYPYFENLQEYIVNIQEQVSRLIQEGSITAEEAVEQVKLNSAHLFNK